MKSIGRISLAMILVGTACSSPAEEPGPAPTVQVEPAAEAEVTPSAHGRSWRRMNIDQLKASIERVSGGISWMEVDTYGEPFDVFDRLSGSLGKPDYLNSNVEELEPALLFQKFLDDAASSVCTRWLERERGQTPGERLLLVHAELADTPESAPQAIEANLRAALVRFHGRPVVAGDPVLAPWTRLISDVWQATGSMEAAWRAACVALFTHPDFYSF